MPFKKMSYTKEDEENDDDADDEEEKKQISVIFPGLHLPSFSMHPDLARRLTKKLPRLRLKIQSTIGRMNLFEVRIKK